MGILQVRKYKALIILTLIAMLFINFLLKRVVIDILPTYPIDVWGWGLIGCVITGLMFAFDFKSTKYDWLWYILFVFFFGVFLCDFDDFITVTLDALQGKITGL